MRNRDSGGTTQQGGLGQDGVNETGGVAEAVADLRACMTDDARSRALRTLETDPSNVDAHLALARHHHFLGVEAGTPDYLSIRYNESDDGSYTPRTDLFDPESEDEDSLRDVMAQTLRQMPLATEAMLHAVKAAVLDPDSRNSQFIVERCLEGIVDAAGTYTVVGTELRRRGGARDGEDSCVRAPSRRGDSGVGVLAAR